MPFISSFKAVPRSDRFNDDELVPEITRSNPLPATLLMKNPVNISSVPSQNLKGKSIESHSPEHSAEDDQESKPNEFNNV